MKGDKMRIDYVNTYSPKFGISEWKKERIRAKAAAAQEEYIRKNSYSSNKINVDSKHYYYDRKPQHPDPCTPGWEDDLKACREFANSLERPDPWSGDYHERLAEWKEYSKYRTKK